MAKYNFTSLQSVESSPGLNSLLVWAQTNPTFHPTLQKFMLAEMLDAFALIRKSNLKFSSTIICQFKAKSSVGCVCADFIQHCSDLVT